MSYEFYTVVIERADGNGLWDMVHRDDHAYGHSAIECADSTLRYRWPVDVYDRTEEPSAQWRRRHDLLKAGGAGLRVVVTPASHNRRGDSGTFTLTEILLARVAHDAAANAIKQVELRQAREALRQAQSVARAAEYNLKEAVRDAELAEVPTAEIARARRQPRAKPTT